MVRARRRPHLPSANTSFCNRAGFYFCPVLPLFGVIFSFITFYVKATCLVYFAEPPSELFSSSRTSKFFFIVLLFTLLVALVPAGYAMTRMVPSSGPHAGQTTAYGLIPQLINASNEGVRNFFTFIGTPAFIIALLCILIICLYYVDTMRKKAAKRLREVERELRVEREDKRYLLRFYNLHR